MIPCGIFLISLSALLRVYKCLLLQDERRSTSHSVEHALILTDMSLPAKHTQLQVDCGNFLASNLAQSLKDDDLTTAQLDAAVIHLFSLRLRLGDFDGTSNPYVARCCAAVARRQP